MPFHYIVPSPSTALLKVIGIGLQTAVEKTGGAIEKNRQHASAMDLHKLIGSFDASNPKSYEPVISAFCEIFVHFNLQFIHLLDAKKLGWYLSISMFNLHVMIQKSRKPSFF